MIARNLFKLYTTEACKFAFLSKTIIMTMLGNCCAVGEKVVREKGGFLSRSLLGVIDRDPGFSTIQSGW